MRLIHGGSAALQDLNCSEVEISPHRTAMIAKGKQFFGGGGFVPPSAALFFCAMWSLLILPSTSLMVPFRKTKQNTAYGFKLLLNKDTILPG